MVKGNIQTARGALALGFVALALVLGALSFPSGASAAGTATYTLAPSSTTLAQGAPLTVTIHANATVTTTGAQTDFNFDETRFEIINFALGSPWTGATELVGVAPQTRAQAIASANSTGTLENLAAYCAPGNCTVPAGNALFVTIQMEALTNGGVSSMSTSQRSMIDQNGDPTTVTSANTINLTVEGPISVGGVVETLTGAGSSDGISSLYLIIAAILGGIALVGMGGAVAVRKS